MIYEQLRKLISIFNSNEANESQEKEKSPEGKSPSPTNSEILHKKKDPLLKKSTKKQKLTHLLKNKTIETVNFGHLNTLINIDNAIITAAQNLLLSEKRMIMLALTQISNLTIEQSNQSSPIRITAKQFSLTYKINIKTAYEQLHDTCDKLLSKHVCWYEETPKGPHQIKMNWLTSCRYAPQEAFIELSFSPEIKKHLLELSSNFTTYKLEQTRALRSIYSWRLLELLTQFKGTGWRQLDLNQFLIVMDAHQYLEKNFSDIRRKIIEPAVKELNEKEKLEITWNAIKNGKKVVAINFIFKKSPKDQKSIALKKIKKLIN